MASLLIYNSTAGQRRNDEVLEIVTHAFGSRMPTLAQTEGPGDAQRLAFEATSAGTYDAIYAAGGDGTVNEVVSGMLRAPTETKPVLGVIPAGTCNVLATELGIPSFDLASAVDVLSGSRTRAIDVGRINDRYFLLMAGFGIDATAVQNVEPFVKALVGAPAYVMSALAVLAQYEPSRIKLVIDDEEIVSDAFLVLIANVSTYGFANVKIAPFAALDDGWLDICVFERPETHTVGFIASLMLMLARRHLGDPRFRYYRARHIRLESIPDIPGQLDGDSAMSTPVTVDVLPKAIRVLVP